MSKINEEENRKMTLKKCEKISQVRKLKIR